MAALSDSLMATSTAPHLSARALDDCRLRSLCEVVAVAVSDMARAGVLPCDEPTALCVEADGRSLTLDDLLRVSEESPAGVGGSAGWLRAYLLALSAEHEFRWRRRPASASLLDVVPRLPDWRVPASPLGRSPSDWTDLLVAEWLHDAERDDPPRWTRRGPPDWLVAEVWRERRANNRDQVGHR